MQFDAAVGQARHYGIIRHHDAGGTVEASDEIDQGALAGARRAHHRDPLAGRDGERDVVERINQSVRAIIFFRSGGITLRDVLESNHPDLIPSTPTLLSES